MNQNKPFKGRMVADRKVSDSQGYVYCGTFEGHKEFNGEYGHTSYVVYEQPHHRGQPFEIETLNSRYTIVPDEKRNFDNLKEAI